MKVIVGLGNPGPRYRHTRHNVGWMVLDELAQRWGLGKVTPEKARAAEILRASLEGEPIVLAKPQTFMNDSGKTVRQFVEKDRLSPANLLVIYDDLDLALGRIRLRTGGSAGGHRGILSIQQHLGQVLKGEAADFPRVKVGLGRPPAGMDPIDFVLASFTPDDLPLIKPAIQRAADAAECWLRDGAEVAMNRFNGAAAA